MKTKLEAGCDYCSAQKWKQQFHLIETVSGVVPLTPLVGFIKAAQVPFLLELCRRQTFFQDFSVLWCIQLPLPSWISLASYRKYFWWTDESTLFRLPVVCPDWNTLVNNSKKQKNKKQETEKNKNKTKKPKT